MNLDALLTAFREFDARLDEFEVALDAHDPEGELADTQSALRQMADAVSADVSRLESGAFA